MERKKRRGRIGREKARKWNRLTREQEEEEYIKEREEKQRRAKKVSETDPPPKKTMRIWLAKTKEIKSKKKV